MGQTVGPPARPKMGRITIFGPFIDGGPVRPNPLLTGHRQTGLTRFDIPTSMALKV